MQVALAEMMILTKVDRLIRTQGSTFTTGTHFACFTSTSVQILAQQKLSGLRLSRFTKVLASWYKSTSTDAAKAQRPMPLCLSPPGLL
jgi:hypothetical protein